ncbi:Putative DNA-binding domain-containing protein [Pseudarcicella hirudinis]|uniref:Putative DNA-binding domain-containing protein n=1 Tax=Pseudarcicella hirudinis TaxID=1079859 RepID=A0A1I5XQL4_9BACT|nr:ATP-binding protein [Pseudarcicella hirudinis]SFQ34252.1 Putative DNA-binding domain-containing protein [Pseudarcicella hirudinis]
MNKEIQLVEWKQIWKDDYLGWLAGYANANGGTLIIGKNDSGNVIGIDNAPKLLVDLPNKIRDVLGIIVDVNLKTENTLEYIEITVPVYSHGISYKGEYHYRSGSTKQILKGASLNKFLLDKSGLQWEAIEVSAISFPELDLKAFDFFQKRSFSNNQIK